MADRFRMRSGLSVVVLPGAGRVRSGQILEGEQYAKFCPSLLEPAPDAPKPTLKPAPQFISSKKSETLPSLPSEDVEIEIEGNDIEFEAEVPPPDMSWRKVDLIEHAEGMGLDVEGLTKRQILAKVDRAGN